MPDIDDGPEAHLGVENDGPDSWGEPMGRPDTDDGPEARLGVENDGPDSWVGLGLVAGPDTGDSKGRLGIDVEPDLWGESVGRPRLS